MRTTNEALLWKKAVSAYDIALRLEVLVEDLLEKNSALLSRVEKLEAKKKPGRPRNVDATNDQI